MKKSLIILVILLLGTCYSLSQQSRPRLLLNQSDVDQVRESLGKYPLFDSVYNQAKAKIDLALINPMDVPVPKDAGGYTHERHKRNYVEMQLAGILYSVTKDEKYARFIRDMLFKYAELYPTLKNHPLAAEESAGRLFWQTLNETVWLVHVSQAYDCIYDFLTPSDRKKIEEGVLRPIAKFFTVDHAPEHDRVHNHGTWTVTAVGMLGYALRDQDLVDKALYGTKKDKSGGFFRQLDSLFSPDGYYTEGAYYVRYAILPFMLFAQAIENNQPEFKIFEYRNQILKKAFYDAMQLSMSDGRFIPFNDALKDMKYMANEMVTALDIVYTKYGADKSLLTIAKQQNSVLLNGAGLTVAKEIAQSSSTPDFEWKSDEFTDGGHGDQGAIGILRAGDPQDQSLALLKYCAQGQGHGHFDRLGLIYYNQSKEQLQDYGSVRFINVEPKNGGRYMTENNSWAKQTIAHNTVTVDEKTQFDFKLPAASEKHGDRHFFSSNNASLQVMSGKELNAYDGVEMQRTIAMINDSSFTQPVIVDVYKLVSKDQHQYDLPFYYMGQFIHANAKYAFSNEQKPLGKKNGYQYLWKQGEGVADTSFQFTWLSGQRYYSVTSSVDSATQFVFARIGANDSNFNLRNDPALILRTKASSYVFASTIEPHGYFEPVSERSDGATGRIYSVNVIGSNDEGTVIEIEGRNSLHWTVLVNNGEASETKEHELSFSGKTYRWTGNYSIQK